MIPKIIHYCWFGGNPMPELAKRCFKVNVRGNTVGARVAGDEQVFAEGAGRFVVIVSHGSFPPTNN